MNYLNLAFVGIAAFLFVWIERKILASSQYRVGPPILQPVYDLLKLLEKETIRNFFASPMLPFVPFVGLSALLVVAAGLPFAGIPASIDIVTTIFLLLLVSVAYPIAGFLSFSPYGYISARRAAIQILSYELPLTLSIISAAIFHQTLSFNNLSGFSFYLLPAMAVFYVCALAAMHKKPFDVPNAVEELVAGSETEFSGIPLAGFKLIEWIEGVILAELFFLLFIGIPDAITHIVSVTVIFSSFAIVEAVTPRLRIDHVTDFFIKYMVPLSIAGVVIACCVRF